MKKYTRSLSVLLAASALTIAGCQNGDEETANHTEADTNQAEEAVEDNEESLSYPQLKDGVGEDEVEVVMETNMGDIHLKLFPEYAPLAVENFITLSEEGYYEDVIFHRIIENFMIQGGDPTGTGMGGESAFGESFEDEFTAELAHFRGALSMANSGPNTNGSQFFIVHAGPEELMAEMFEGSGFPEETVEHYLEYGGTPHLDGGHTVFGHVIDGMDVVDAIATVDTEGPNNSTPVEDVYIESVRVLD
ncbi:peptidylprolyl isomerase [Salisediminibacterium selenitireducens]|uniref:Peptidyl-prolyl cis-trans isomerase n=1 Tax=Bacillus selenitireducens (strain ATCC 700615 / DSM 15326 / MLS10) TaxID=439292 RepID=D6XUA7_BACIE|nr:peptidylprolyl isomerase [Salisediminibacterium selenitireducens]ADH99393.1 Peptidylprolyl isomerase [[Bacillus] selenitireducens MLS10]